MRRLHDFISPVDQYGRGGGRLKTLPHISQRCMLLMLGISAEAESNVAHHCCMILTRAVRNSRCQSCQVEDRAGGGTKASVTVGRSELGKVSAAHGLLRPF